MRIIAIALFALVLAHGGASAQTADERARILRDFQQRVADYTLRHTCLHLCPEALDAATPATRIFTPPVAMVFRQAIARALADRSGAAAINGVGVFAHPELLKPFPPDGLSQFPAVLRNVLPPLPAPLEYRLVGHDLVIRDRNADVSVAVLRDATGNPRIVVR